MEAPWYSFLPQALVAVASMTAIATSLWKDRHPLASVERLTSLTDKMRPGTTRDAFTDYRDQRATLWLLDQRAPREATLLNLGRWLVIGAGLSFLIWLGLALMNPTSIGTWTAYGLGLAQLFLCSYVFQRRRMHRRSWIEQEALWRQLTLPIDAKRVRK